MKSRNPRKERSMFFICGHSFKNQKEDDFEVLWASPSPSRKSRTHMFCCIRNKAYNKNPYSNRGLDKFEALLADLDDKKQKIFTQKGSQYISIVRFVYSNSNDMKPVIVRWKDPRKHDHKDHHKQNHLKDPRKNEHKDHHKQTKVKESKSSSLSKPQGSVLDDHKDHEPHEDVTNEVVNSSIDMLSKKIRIDHQWKLNLKRKLEEWWMPSYNLPLFVILVMVFLTVLGRSLAIICTSIAWYLIPTSIDKSLQNTTARSKNMIKNQPSRKVSETEMISSPKSFFSGPINVKQSNKMKKLMSF